MEYTKYLDFKTLKQYFNCLNNKEKDAYVDLKDHQKISFFDFKNKAIYGAYSLYLKTDDKTHNCAIISDNSLEYVLSYFSIVFSNNVAVLIAGIQDEDSLKSQIKQTNCDILFVSNRYIDKIEKIKKNLKVKEIIILENEKNSEYKKLKEMIEYGEVNNALAFDYYYNLKVEPNQLCEILFTSGTAGYNKAVMLSNENICCSIRSSLKTISKFDSTISVLPFYHSYESSCHLLPSLFLECTNYINDSLINLKKNIKAVPAGIMIVVPMFLENFERQLIRKAKKDYLFKIKILISKLLRKNNIDIRESLFKEYRSIISNTITTFGVGGAPIKDSTYDLLDNIGYTILLGYGETECSPLISHNEIDDIKRLSVGKIIDDMEVDIINKNSKGIGEIIVKGKGMMLGYYKDEKANQEVFENGWIHTGDLGYIDNRGYLYIKGRKKNLIILSNGENVHPEELETLLLSKIKYLKEIVVSSNDEQTSIIASTFLDKEYFKDNTKEEIYNHLQKDIESINKKLPIYKRINEIRIMEEPFKKNAINKIKRQYKSLK